MAEANGAAVSFQEEVYGRTCRKSCRQESLCTGQMGNGGWHSYRLDVEAGVWRETLPDRSFRGGGGKDGSNSMPASCQCILVHNVNFKVMHCTY